MISEFNFRINLDGDRELRGANNFAKRIVCNSYNWYHLTISFNSVLHFVASFIY